MHFTNGGNAEVGWPQTFCIHTPTHTYTNTNAPNSNRTPILHLVTINFAEFVIAGNNRNNKSHLILP